MRKLKRHKKIFLVYCSIVFGILVFTKCINNESEKKETTEITDTSSLKIIPVKNITYEQFAGSVVCANCHKKIYDNYIHTAHNFTSQIASAKSIKGSFKPGENFFAYNEDRIVRLEKKDSGFYQVYYYQGAEHVVRKFDIVVGSGTKGQTYLSWVNNQLIELPVSYFTAYKTWANSPGYPLYPTLFNRPATTRCMECHSTYAATLTPSMQEPEKFDSTKIILTVGCEKCHGPAARHVAYQTQNPKDTVGKFIVNPAKLSTKLNIDVCALCHAGRLQKTKPSFEFVAGDTLSNYFIIDTTAKNINDLDVHGNQFGLLAASKCFKMSKTMTCITCHDAHKNERKNMQIFSQRCMSCHTTQHKTVEGISINQLKNNCIDCHMPLQQSMSIGFLLQGETVPTHAMMRTHFIAVYSDETKKFINNLVSSQKKKS
ncbi:MAG: multiheme c-type cytochrome [Chitinophagaceae bacterium]